MNALMPVSTARVLAGRCARLVPDPMVTTCMGTTKVNLAVKCCA